MKDFFIMLGGMLLVIFGGIIAAIGLIGTFVVTGFIVASGYPLGWFGVPIGVIVLSLGITMVWFGWDLATS